MLQAKQMQLREVLSGGGEGQVGPTPEERQLEQQREEYGRRGIRYPRPVVGVLVACGWIYSFKCTACLPGRVPALSVRQPGIHLENVRL